jgi:integrating conjugative element protein (TIGR03759 family)
MIRVATAILLLIFSLTIVADEDVTVKQHSVKKHTEAILSQQSEPVAEPDEKIYSQWGLSRDEWLQYQLALQGPLGKLNPNLDPLLALSMVSESEEQIVRYIERYIHLRTQLTQRIQDLEKLYQKTYLELYPGPLIDYAKLNPGPHAIWPGDRFVLVTRSDCIDCTRPVQSILRRTRSFKNNPLDIFLQDESDSEKLVAWAKQIIEKEDMESGRVSLNLSSPYLDHVLEGGQSFILLIRRDDELLALDPLKTFYDT